MYENTVNTFLIIRTEGTISICRHTYMSQFTSGGEHIPTSFQAKNCNQGCRFRFHKPLTNLALGWELTEVLLAHVIELIEKRHLELKFHIILSSVLDMGIGVFIIINIILGGINSQFSNLPIFVIVNRITLSLTSISFLLSGKTKSIIEELQS